MSAPGPRETQRDEKARATRNHREECLEKSTRSWQKTGRGFAHEDQMDQYRGAGQKEREKLTAHDITAWRERPVHVDAPGARLDIVFRPCHLLPLAAALLLPRCPTHEARSLEPAREQIGSAPGTGRLCPGRSRVGHARKPSRRRLAQGAQRSVLPPPGPPPGSAALGAGQRASSRTVYLYQGWLNIQADKRC